jgi:hypothetical protein
MGDSGLLAGGFALDSGDIRKANVKKGDGVALGD